MQQIWCIYRYIYIDTDVQIDRINNIHCYIVVQYKEIRKICLYMYFILIIILRT